MLAVRFLLTIILFAGLLPRFAESAAVQSETIRVAVSRGKESIRVGGYGITVSTGDGRPVELAAPFTIKREKSGISSGQLRLNSLIISSPGVIQINGKGYRGTIEVVAAARGLLVIDEIQLEDYLVGLINCEISSQWPIEAVKAQVVIARSFALYQKASRKNMAYHLESTVYDQVYDGCDIEDTRAARAVEETAGEVLTFEGSVIPAFFHSSCGGHTEASENVWSMKLPYLRGVECTYCMSSPSVIWEQTIPRSKIESILGSAGYRVRGLKEIRPISRNRSGRITSLELVSGEGRTTIQTVTFRKLMGYGVIRSTGFEVKLTDEGFTFIGVGYGHGVGLCQWGAKRRAEEGFSYREILSYYYPGTRISKGFTE